MTFGKKIKTRLLTIKKMVFLSLVLFKLRWENNWNTIENEGRRINVKTRTIDRSNR